ncbi:hypothetical protein ESZ36_20205 [Colwellia demingiae]|uniref:Uncharacterized protein n=1 Tax=Colwellia demingiae TaxID=89401 RepID=A0A5C6Q6F5_9GAMM|nr:hypothetical protein [Colwellia demingiae]TWX64300.1 hypothetical protein ESZ36_20205 [Colwellia demingiae]
MARYRPSEETLAMFKEDLPDDIENIVDDVAAKTEKVVDDLIDQYDASLKEKSVEYKQKTDELFANFDKEVSEITEQSEQYLDQMQEKLAALTKSTDALKQAIDSQSDLNLDVTLINERSNELNSVISAQRKKIQKISATTGKYVGSMARTLLPI